MCKLLANGAIFYLLYQFSCLSSSFAMTLKLMCHNFSLQISIGKYLLSTNHVTFSWIYIFHTSSSLFKCIHVIVCISSFKKTQQSNNSANHQIGKECFYAFAVFNYANHSNDLNQNARYIYLPLERTTYSLIQYILIQNCTNAIRLSKMENITKLCI